VHAGDDGSDRREVVDVEGVAGDDTPRKCCRELRFDRVAPTFVNVGDRCPGPADPGPRGTGDEGDAPGYAVVLAHAASAGRSRLVTTNLVLVEA
jgi:hypothetical protein